MKLNDVLYLQYIQKRVPYGCKNLWSRMKGLGGFWFGMETTSY